MDSRTLGWMLMFWRLSSRCLRARILLRMVFIFHLMWMSFLHWLNICQPNSSQPQRSHSCSSACSSSTAIRALFSCLASSFLRYYSFLILSLRSFINYVKVAFMTANVKLSKNQAPTNTKGMK